MMLTLDIDATGIERTLNKLGDSLTSFAPEMKQIRALQARSVDLNFRNQGRPVRWLALRGSTITARRARARSTGKVPVAGFDTPLRVTDTLRRSLVDLTGSATGSASFTNDTEAVTGTSLDYAPTQQFGLGRIPSRPFLAISDDDSIAYQNILNNGLKKRVKEAGR